MDVEFAGSEHCSSNDKVLLEVVTCAVARLQLDWPRQQETPKRSKWMDRFLSSGQEKEPQHWPPPFSEEQVMTMLRAFQADLLKDLSAGGSINEETFSELHWATDLSLCATKQTARAISRTMDAWSPQIPN